MSSALWAYQTAYKTTTGQTPFNLVYGLEAMVPLEYVVSTLRTMVDGRLPEKQSEEERIHVLLRLEEVRLQSAWQTKLLKGRTKAWAYRNRKYKLLEVGDAVLLFNMRMGKHPGKLKMRWEGLYIIGGCCGVGTFILQALEGTKLEKPMNGFRLKLYQGQIPQLMITSGVVLMELIVESGESTRTKPRQSAPAVGTNKEVDIKATSSPPFSKQGPINMENPPLSNGLPTSPINSEGPVEALYGFMPSYMEAMSLSSLIPLCALPTPSPTFIV